MLPILTRTLFPPASKSAKGLTGILSRLRTGPGFLKWLVPPLLVAAGLKTWLVLSGVVPFNADEAVVALMARHILQGARPVFFYGQAYMGSLDAWLIAGGFTLFGQEVWVIRLVQGLLYLLTLATTALLGKTALGSWRAGLLAVWLLAIPTVNVTLYTTVSLGGYNEALLIGNLILIVGLQIVKGLRTYGSYNAGGISAFHPLSPALSPIKGERERPSGLLFLIWGFLVGLGVWTFGLTLLYALPMGAVLAAAYLRFDRSAKLPMLLLLGLLLGSAPWWGYALFHGFGPLIAELRGGNIAGVEGLGWLSMVAQHTLSLLLLGSSVTFGLRPPWEVRWLGLPLLPFVLMFWVGTLVYAIRSTISDWRLAISDQATADRRPPTDTQTTDDGRPRTGDQRPTAVLDVQPSMVSGRRSPDEELSNINNLHRRTMTSAVGGRLSSVVRRPSSVVGRLVLLGLMLTLILGFILTPFGADPSGRYFIPLAVPMALFAAELILDLQRKIGRWAWSLVILVLFFNFWSTVQCAERYPPGLTTQFNAATQVDMDASQALMAFLRRQGETVGYTNYWVAYPLAFLSGEELIFVPRLPYHQDFRYTSRDDRYAPYDEIVAQAGRTAFITTDHPELDERLRQGFSRKGISWQERQIGDYHVFYHFSGKFSPESLDFVADSR